MIDNTFPAGHKIKDVRVERRTFQYLYKDDLGFHFMNNETYAQVFLSGDMISNNQLLKEGTNVEMLLHAETEQALSVDLPQYIILEVTYTEPGVKGDTATNTQKPATVETGAEVRVPLFINIGDKVKIDSASGNYVERAK